MDFTDVVQPSEAIRESGEPVGTSDLSCDVCGGPLVYGGRGRKPKRHPECKGTGAATAGGSRKATVSGDVAAAVAALDNLYSLVAAGLFFVSPAAAMEWTERYASLTEQNKAILTADRNLAKSIAKTGARGGKVAFAVAHVAAIAPVGAVLARDLGARRAARVPAEEQAPESHAAYAPADTQGDVFQFPRPEWNTQ